MHDTAVMTRKPGRPKSAVARVPLTTTIDESLKQGLEAVAGRRPINTFLEDAIREYLKKHGEPAAAGEKPAPKKRKLQ
jgi:hypothetical protein